MGLEPTRRAAALYGLAAACSALCAAPCVAQVTETSPGHYSCAAESGQSASAEIRPFAHMNAIGAQIRFVAPRRHLEFPATASLRFVLNDGRRTGIVVQVWPANARILVLGIKVPGSPEPELFMFVPSNRILTIATILDEDGTLTVRSGGRSMQWRVGPVHMVRREMQCQSGSFEIDLSASEAISRAH